MRGSRWLLWGLGVWCFAVSLIAPGFAQTNAADQILPAQTGPLAVDFLGEGAGSSSILGFFFLDIDTSEDGTPDFFLVGPNDDLDGDGQINSIDSDDDGDGIPDALDVAGYYVASGAQAGFAPALAESMPAEVFRNGPAAAAAGDHPGDYWQFVPNAIYDYTDGNGSTFTEVYREPGAYLYVDQYDASGVASPDGVPDVLQTPGGFDGMPAMCVDQDFYSQSLANPGVDFPGLLGNWGSHLIPTGQTLFYNCDDDGGAGVATQFSSFSPYTQTDIATTVDGFPDYLIYGTTDESGTLIPEELKADDGNGARLWRYRSLGPVVSANRELVFFFSVFWSSGGNEVNTYYTKTRFNPDVAGGPYTISGATTGDNFGTGSFTNWFPQFQNASDHDDITTQVFGLNWDAISDPDPARAGLPLLAVAPATQGWMEQWQNYDPANPIVQYRGVDDWFASQPTAMATTVQGRYGFDMIAISDAITLRAQDRTTPTLTVLPHAALYRPAADPGSSFLAWEDLYGGGDRDFEDTVFYIKQLSVAPVTVDPLVSSYAAPQLGGWLYQPTTSVSVTVDGQTFAGTIDGLRWSAVVPVSLADGTYDVAVTVDAGTDATTDELTITDPPPEVISILPTVLGPTNTTSITLQIAFSEPVTNFDDLSDFELSSTPLPGASNGAVLGVGGATITGGPTFYTVHLTGLSGEGVLDVTLSTVSDVVDFSGRALIDSAANVTPTSPGYTGVAIDRQLSYTLAASPLFYQNYTNATTLTFQLDFGESQPVLGFDTPGDYAISETGATTHTLELISGMGSLFNVTLTQVDGDGTVSFRPTISIEGSDVMDWFGNMIIGGPDETVIIDQTPPQLLDVVALDGAYTNSTTARISFDFDEIVMDWDGVGTQTLLRDSSFRIQTQRVGYGASQVLEAALSDDYTVRLDGLNYTGGVGDPPFGTVTVSLDDPTTITDRAGNSLASGTVQGLTFVYDPFAPLINSITLIDAWPGAGDSVTWQIYFNEGVQGFDPSDVNVITSGSVGYGLVEVTAVSSTTYWVTVAGLTPRGNVQIGVTPGNNILDLAGNPLGPDPTLSALEAIDIAAVGIFPLVLGTPTEIVDFITTFTEPVSGFDTEDDVIVEVNGNIDYELTILGGPQYYTVRVTSVSINGACIRIKVRTESEGGDVVAVSDASPLRDSVFSPWAAIGEGTICNANGEIDDGSVNAVGDLWQFY